MFDEKIVYQLSSVLIGVAQKQSEHFAEGNVELLALYRFPEQDGFDLEIESPIDPCLFKHCHEAAAEVMSQLPSFAVWFEEVMSPTMNPESPTLPAMFIMIRKDKLWLRKR